METWHGVNMFLLKWTLIGFGFSLILAFFLAIGDLIFHDEIREKTIGVMGLFLAIFYFGFCFGIYLVVLRWVVLL